MTELITLGIAVDSRQVTTATTALNSLTAAAAPASAAATKLQNATSGVSATMAGFEKSLKSATAEINDLSAVGQRGIDALRAKFNPLFAAGQQYKQQLSDIRDAHRVGALSQAEFAAATTRTKEAFANQVVQIKGSNSALDAATLSVRGQRQVLRGLATDMAFLGGSQVGGLAGTAVQLYAANARVITSFGDLKNTLAGLITPARLVAIGLVAIGAAGYAAFSSWKTFALQLDDTAKRAGTTTTEMSKLQSAASFKGIDNAEFAKGMAQFSDNVYLAKNNMGGLAEIIRANGVPAIRDFDDAIDKVAVLVQRAGSEQQKYVILQQAGLPATAEWVRLLSGGAEGLRKAKAEAVAFGGAINNDLVNKARAFDDAWNKGWSNFTKGARGAVVDTISWLDRLGDAATAVMMKLPFVGKNVPTNMLKSAFDGTGVASTRLTANSDVKDLYGKTGADVGTRLTVTNDPAAERTRLQIESPFLMPLANLATAQQIKQTKPVQKDKSDERTGDRRAA